MTDYSDLAKRLRGPDYWLSGSDDGGGGENSAPLDAADAIEALQDRVERAERRAYDLAVAIMGGEDAPGYAYSVPTEQLVEQARKHALEWEAAQAEVARLRVFINLLKAESLIGGDVAAFVRGELGE